MIFILLFVLSMLIAFFMIRQKPFKPVKDIAYLVLELGHLQIYSYEAHKESKAHSSVWWRDFKEAPNLEYGPFLSINEAMRHYSLFISNKTSKVASNVIAVNFKDKKRVT